ncbi:MAG: hypothetical protein NTV65_03240 [Proteobacteria bacterium]|nr:hypothetical protein [Pseudomonadota bacterium]
MDPIAWIVIVIMGIGAIIAGVIGLGVLIMCWWWIIALIGALTGGFVFGLGLVAIIGIIVLIVRAVFKTKSDGLPLFARR